MLTAEQNVIPVEGITVFDTVVMLQIIGKLLKGGLVEGKELSFVAAARSKLVQGLRQASGIDYDNAAQADGSVVMTGEQEENLR